jgi:hypothetical protein
MKKDNEENYFWRLTLAKQTHLTATKTLVLTETLKPTDDMTRTVLLQLEVRFLFGQDHEFITPWKRYHFKKY